jgi:hypothetical protein
MLPDGVRVDVFTAWITVTQFHPRLMPDDVIDACELALGKLEGMTDRAEARRPTSCLDMSALNPRVWEAARGMWQNGHHRQAVEAAYGALLDDVKSRTERSGLSDDDVFGQAFSSDPLLDNPVMPTPTGSGRSRGPCCGWSRVPDCCDDLKEFRQRGFGEPSPDRVSVHPDNAE